MSSVDIVIPIYNNQNEINNCLKSIFNQTFQDFKIVIINDGSTDDTLDKVNKYIAKLEQEQQSKVQIINQGNKGSNPARNRGAKETKAKYILFCDADITLNHNYLQLTKDFLEKNSDKSFCYSSFIYSWKTFILWQFDAAKLKKMPYIHTTSLIKKEHFPGFDEKIKRLQDWDLWLTMLEHGHTGIWIDKILFKVNTKHGKISGKWMPAFMYRIPWLKTVKEYKKAVQVIKEKHNL